MQDTDRDFAAVPRQDLVVEEIDGDLVILDKMREQIHQLNGTASIIWSAIASGQSSGKIAAKLVDLFDVSIETATNDIKIVIGRFESLHLLTTNK
jgi:Coenzyme PQQ synthesis protein D (PqqD)